MDKELTENQHGESLSKKEYKRDPNKDYSYIKWLLNVFFVQEPFYGRIINRFIIKEDWKEQTAYVKFDYEFYKETGRITYILGYNPEFIDAELCGKYKDKITGQIITSSTNKPYKEIAFLFIHEVLHTLLGHLTDRTILSQDVYEMHIANIAMDLAINSMILAATENMNPDIALFPLEVGFYPGRKPNIENEEFAEFVATLPQLQTTVFYFNKIKDFLKNQESKNKKEGEGNGRKVKIFLNGCGDKLNGLTGFDSHNWEDLPKEIREEVKSNMRNHIKEALNAASKQNSWGSMSAAIKEVMGKIAAESPVDWRMLLENAIGQCRIQDHESTYRKISKKLPMMLPGEKKRTSQPIAFFIDQSGSMSNDEVQLAFAQAANCAKIIEVDVYNFDTEVDVSSHVVWKNNLAYSWKRTRSGGTDFNAIKKFIEDPTQQKRNWRWVVILTDGYAPELEPLQAKVLWLITPSGKEPDNIRPQDLVAKMKFPGSYTEESNIY